MKSVLCAVRKTCESALASCSSLVEEERCQGALQFCYILIQVYIHILPKDHTVQHFLSMAMITISVLAASNGIIISPQVGQVEPARQGVPSSRHTNNQ